MTLLTSGTYLGGRSPVIENGEAPRDSDKLYLQEFFDKDIELLNKASIIFAIPQERDPGTLVEMGIAISQGKPIVTYDPYEENNNTMVICSSSCYSNDLDICLNSVFECLSKIRNKRA